MPHQRNRIAVTRIQKLASLWPVLGIVGARQTGKTTCVRDLLGLSNYVTLDDDNALQEAKTSSKLFLAKRALPLLIDEVQKAPGLFDAIKLIVDKKRMPGQFYLTGSTQFSSKIGIRESLTGRIGLLKLFPFTFAEANAKPAPHWKSIIHGKSFSVESSTIAKMSMVGGMPVPSFIRDQDQRKLYWQGWLETTVYRDLLKVYGRSYDPDISWTILRDLAKVFREGELPTLSQFSLSSRKIRPYLEAMETIFLISKIPGHTESIGGDCWFFLDSGLVAYLMESTSGDGATLSLIRHYIFNEIAANHEYGQGPFRWYYYRSAKGSPIDMIIENQKETLALKIILEGSASHGKLGWQERALAGAIKTLKIKKGFLISPMDRVEIPKAGIGILPYGYWS